MAVSTRRSTSSSSSSSSRWYARACGVGGVCPLRSSSAQPDGSISSQVCCGNPRIRAGERPRHEIQRDIKVKERAREVLAKRHSSSRLSDEDILQCIYSISDNNSYLLFNRKSCPV